MRGLTRPHRCKGSNKGPTAPIRATGTPLTTLPRFSFRLEPSVSDRRAETAASQHGGVASARRTRAGQLGSASDPLALLACGLQRVGQIRRGLGYRGICIDDVAQVVARTGLVE